MGFILQTILISICGFYFCAFSEAKEVKIIDGNQLETNPYLLDKSDIAPFVFVIFGATGDLTARKLLPAVYNLWSKGHLSEKLAVVGVARGMNTHESFRNKMEEAVNQFNWSSSHYSVFWNQFKNKIFYHQSEFEDDQRYENLKEFLNQIDQELGTKSNRIYYLAVQPNYYSTIITNLKKHQLIYEANGQNDLWSRVVIEKPFGYDLNSAIQLQQQISQFLAKTQIYRMDHYLGKEGVQNLLAFRCISGLFEPLWNHHYIDNIQITLAEEIGIGTRAHFWEKTGSLRDVLQNHLMQLLSIIAMDLPVDLNAESISKEKIRLLESIRPFSLSEINECVIRGQYGPGIVRGKLVAGYKEEKGVALTSAIETFIAIKFFIDNERWQGVPFYIRSGKRLAKQTTEIAVTFKKNRLSDNQDPNVLFIRIQPNAGIFLKTVSKVPGFYNHLSSVTFGYNPDDIFETSSPEAYERVIFDCAKGSDYLFVTAEEQIAAWRLLTPILDYWKTHFPDNFPNYEAGTWGPKEANQMLLKDGYQWQLLRN